MGWFKKNWFRIVIFFMVLMAVASFYYLRVIENDNEIECTAKASNDHDLRWNKECKNRGLLSNQCEFILLETEDILDAFRKWREAKYLNETSEWNRHAHLDEFEGFYNSCSCELPSNIGLPLRKIFEDDIGLCLK